MIKLGPVLIFPSRVQAGTMGRPSLRTPETVAKICAAIRERGHTDTHAAARAGVSSSAVSRWRQEDEEFALQLDAARVDYLDARLLAISETRKRDGSLDWRAQAWLIQAAAPEVYGPPSRRHAAREKQRAEEEPQDDPNVLSLEDQKHYQQWRAYSLDKMNGMGEEEARWRAHFLHHDHPPVFPGSLAMAGAEIPPPVQLTPEQAAQMADIRRRREVAMRAIAKQDEEMRRAAARARGEEVEDAPEDAATDDDVKEPERPRPEFQNETNLPESQAEQPAGAAFSNVTNIPESRRAVPEVASRGEGAPTPWTGATPAEGASGGGRNPAAPRGPSESWHDFVTRISAGRKPQNLDELAAAEQARNGANIPESPTHGEMCPPKVAAPRPLAGAALAAVEAKEWRRINRLMEEEFQRSTDRAMAVAEAAGHDAMPGMWAGL